MRNRPPTADRGTRFVEAALARGAAKVYATARTPRTWDDERGVPPNLTLDDDRVRLVAVVSDGEASSLVHLQSVADEATTVTLGFGVDVTSVERTTFLGDTVGPLELRGSTVALELRPYESVGVRVLRG